jgi:hypothetical protein
MGLDTMYCGPLGARSGLGCVFFSCTKPVLGTALKRSAERVCSVSLTLTLHCLQSPIAITYASGREIRVHWRMINKTHQNISLSATIN